MRLEESDGSAVALQSCDLAFELQSARQVVACVRIVFAVRGAGADGAFIAAAAACVARTNASRPTSRTLKRFPPERGQVRGPQGTARVSRSKHRTRTDTTPARTPYKWIRNPVTSVTERDNVARLRGRDSNPNFLVQSQASCR